MDSDGPNDNGVSCCLSVADIRMATFKVCVDDVDYQNAVTLEMPARHTLRLNGDEHPGSTATMPESRCPLPEWGISAVG